MLSQSVYRPEAARMPSDVGRKPVTETTTARGSVGFGHVPVSESRPDLVPRI